MSSSGRKSPSFKINNPKFKVGMYVMIDNKKCNYRIYDTPLLLDNEWFYPVEFNLKFVDSLFISEHRINKYCATNIFLQ